MRKIYLLGLFTVLALLSNAQTTYRLTDTSYTVSQLDTSVFHSFTISDSLYITGTSTSNDSVSFGAKANNTVLNSQQFTATSFTPNDTLFQNQRVPVTFTFSGDTAPPFVIGNNTIVVWPIIRSGGNTLTPDTVRINASYYPLGMAEAPLAKIFIYQIQSHLNIVFGDAENIVQQVRIYDMLGQGLYSGSPERSKNISTAGWTAGTYLCEIVSAGGEHRTFKFRVE